MERFRGNVLAAVTIALGAVFGASVQAATVTSVSEIVIGDPTKPFGVALMDIGVAGPDGTFGYDVIIRVASDLELIQIATTGGSSIAASNAPAGAAVPVLGTPPAGLTPIGNTNSSNLLIPAGATGDVFASVFFFNAYFIDTLQLAFRSSTPGSHKVDVVGFSEGYYTPGSSDVSSRPIDLSFNVKVSDPTPVIPLPAGLPLLLAGLGGLAILRRRKA